MPYKFSQICLSQTSSSQKPFFLKNYQLPRICNLNSMFILKYFPEKPLNLRFWTEMSMTNSMLNYHPLTIEIVDKKHSLHRDNHIVLQLLKAGCGQIEKIILPGNPLPLTQRETGTQTMAKGAGRIDKQRQRIVSLDENQRTLEEDIQSILCVSLWWC